MKKIILVLVLVFLSLNIFAQNPFRLQNKMFIFKWMSDSVVLDILNKRVYVDTIYFKNGSKMWDTTSTGAASLWTKIGNYTKLTTISDSVGIGTATPASKFEVNGTSTMDAINATIINGTNYRLNGQSIMRDSANSYSIGISGNNYSMSTGFRKSNKTLTTQVAVGTKKNTFNISPAGISFSSFAGNNIMQFDTINYGVRMYQGYFTDVVNLSGRKITINKYGVVVDSGLISVTTGNVEVTTGNVKVDSGNVEVTTGNVEVTTGNVKVDSGNVEVTTGHVKVTAGDVAVNTGNVKVDSGNVEVDSGNVKITSGSIISAKSALAVVNADSSWTVTAKNITATDTLVTNKFKNLGYMSGRNPHADYTDTVNQTVGSTTAAYTMKFRNREDTLGVYCVGDTAFHFRESGDYEFIISAIADETSTDKVHMGLWFMKNATIVPRSNNIIELPTKDTELIVCVSKIFEITAGDVVRIKYWGSSTTSRWLYTAAGTNPTRPSSPSVAITIKKVGD